MKGMGSACPVLPPDDCFFCRSWASSWPMVLVHGPGPLAIPSSCLLFFSFMLQIYLFFYRFLSFSLFSFFHYHFSFFGQRTRRGRSPVEHRGNLSIRTYVRTSVRPSPPEASEAGQAPRGWPRPLSAWSRPFRAWTQASQNLIQAS